VRNGPYELVIAPEDYPGKKYRERYCYEHQLVWWERTGQVVPVGFLIHHKNEDKRDNRFNNLEMKSKGEHTRDHNKPAKMISYRCNYCESVFERSLRVMKSSLKNGRRVSFCSRSCGAKYYHQRGIYRSIRKA